MAATSESGFPARFLRWAGLWVCIAGFASAGWAMAQEVPVPDSERVTTLHVYTNLLQVPVLVRGPNRQRLAEPIAPSQFSLNIDSGPWFKATHVRAEGDDAISLSILLDVHGDATLVMDKIGEEIASLAANSLHAKDHVSIYALDCLLVRGAADVPASAEGLKLGVDTVLAAWKERMQMKPAGRCQQTVHLRDALMKMIGGLSDLPGRRVILAVTDGKDRESKAGWVEVKNYAQSTGTAVFGVIAYPIVLQHVYLETSISRGGVRFGVEDPFNALCELSGGMVTAIDNNSMKSALERNVAMLRERYIVEFPRPSNSTAGRHGLSVRVENADDFIRVAGASMPMPDPAVLADPTTISAGPSNTPVQGARRVLGNKR